MGWIPQLFTRRRRYAELSETIREHLDEKIADLIDRGLTREGAEQTARREFGNVTLIKERSREVWQWPTLESILADVKFSFRKLRKSPGFALTAILTLAFGIGANVVVFSILNGLLLRPLNVPHPENLVQITRGKGDDSQSYPDYRDFRDRDPSFSGILASEYIRARVSASATRRRRAGVPPFLRIISMYWACSLLWADSSTRTTIAVSARRRSSC